MKKIILQTLSILCLLVFIFSKTNAQGVGINATGALPDASALLHVDAGTKGFLITGTTGGSVPKNESLKASVGELQRKFAEQQKLIEQILNERKKQ